MAYPPEDRVDHPDIQSPPTERLVPDTERTLPTSRNTVLILGIVSVILIIAAAFFAYGVGNKTLGLICGIAAFVLAGVATMMAYGDARTGMVTPALATITAGILSLVIGLDLAGTDEELRDTSNNLAPTITGTPTTVPADPAEIIDPEPEDAQPAAR